jgi:hypothetical protein
VRARIATESTTTSTRLMRKYPSSASSCVLRWAGVQYQVCWKNAEIPEGSRIAARAMAPGGWGRAPANSGESISMPTTMYSM